MSGADISSQLEQLKRDVDEIKSRNQISEVLYAAARAADRADQELQASCFHPDGEDYRGVANGPFMLCVDTLGKWAVTQSRHTVSNISIKFLTPDSAQVETYVDAFHFWGTDVKGGGRFEFIQARYLDRFERRNGQWKIVRRMTIWDECWMEGEKPSWMDGVAGEYVKENKFMRGTRDRRDPYYTFKLPEGF